MEFAGYSFDIDDYNGTLFSLRESSIRLLSKTQQKYEQINKKVIHTPAHDNETK